MKTIFKLSLVSVALVFTVACKKSDSSGPAVVAPIGGQNCLNCFSNGTELLSNVNTQTNNGNFLGIFNILGDPNAGYNLADPRVVNYYFGPVQLVGSVRVLRSDDYYLCYAQAGDYQVRTVQMGALMQGRNGFAPILLEAVSSTGGRMLMRVYSAVLVNSSGSGLDRTSPANRLGMDILLEQVDGRPCGTIVTF